MREFAKMNRMNGKPEDATVFLLDGDKVTITALRGNESAARWAGYISDPESAWPEHMKTQSPLSSLFRGTYTELDYSEFTDGTEGEYQKMLSDLRDLGATRSVMVKLQQSE
jgi:hypothetical protein